MTVSWTSLLVDQLDFYLRAHLLPRLEGLGEDEYLWEPVPGAWSVRPTEHGFAMDPADPEAPERPSTIAWRLAHVAVQNLGTRARCFFGPDAHPDSPDMFDPRWLPSVPGTVEDTLTLLTAEWERWRDGLVGLGDEGLAAPIGPRGNAFAGEPMAALVLHVSRETMHHGGEVCLLRDLYTERR